MALMVETSERVRERCAMIFDDDVNSQDPLDTVEFARRYYLQRFKEFGDHADLKEATTCAQVALPFLRPRLASVETVVTHQNNLSQMTDEQLLRLLNQTTVHAEQLPAPSENADEEKPHDETD